MLALAANYFKELTHSLTHFACYLSLLGIDGTLGTDSSGRSTGICSTRLEINCKKEKTTTTITTTTTSTFNLWKERNFAGCCRVKSSFSSKLVF